MYNCGIINTIKKTIQEKWECRNMAKITKATLEDENKKLREEVARLKKNKAEYDQRYRRLADDYSHLIAEHNQLKSDYRKLEADYEEEKRISNTALLHLQCL